MRRLRIGMAQINTTVGDFAGNTRKILGSIDEARSLGVDLLTFPELAMCGYPPEDLLFKPKFIGENLRSLEKVVEGSSGLSIVVLITLVVNMSLATLIPIQQRGFSHFLSVVLLEFTTLLAKSTYSVT